MCDDEWKLIPLSVRETIKNSGDGGQLESICLVLCTELCPPLPPNLYFEVLTPNVTVFGSKIFRR